MQWRDTYHTRFSLWSTILHDTPAIKCDPHTCHPRTRCPIMFVWALGVFPSTHVEHKMKSNISYFKQSVHTSVQRSLTIHSLIIKYSSFMFIHNIKCIIHIRSSNRILINEALKMCIINHSLIYVSDMKWQRQMRRIMAILVLKQYFTEWVSFYNIIIREQ